MVGLHSDVYYRSPLSIIAVLVEELKDFIIVFWRTVICKYGRFSIDNI